MRNRRKREKNHFMKIVIVFVLCTLTISVGYSLLQQSLSVSGTANLLAQPIPTGLRSENLVLTYEMQTWGNGNVSYQYNFKLTNDGNKTVDNWSIDILVPSKTSIVDSWVAESTIDGNYLHIVPGDSDGQLEPGESLNFGVQITNKTSGYVIETVTIKELEAETPGGDNPDAPASPNLNVTFSKDSSWGNPGAYTISYSVSLTNTGTEKISNWYFGFYLPQGCSIANGYNFNYVNQDGHVLVSGLNWNKNLNPGESISFGFQMNAPSLDVNLEVG